MKLEIYQVKLVLMALSTNKQNKNMAIKIIKLTYYCIALFLFSNLSNAQVKDTKLGYMKKYAFCNCVYINNVKVDANNKFHTIDKSSNLFIDLGKISDDESQKIRDYTYMKTIHFTDFQSEYFNEHGLSYTIMS
ncbi:hypothetical protein ACWA1F_07305 [Flavobacterium sp. 3-218]